MLSMHLFEIDKMYQPEEYSDIALYFRVSARDDANSYSNTIIDEKVVHVYPYGEEHVVQYTREVEDTDIVLVDNEYVTILVRGYEDSEIVNGDIKFYFVNKTEERVEFEIEDIYINDIRLDCPYYVEVNAGCSAFHRLTSESSLMLNSIGEHGITKAEEFKLHFRVYPIDYVSRHAIGEDIVNETFTLIP